MMSREVHAGMSTAERETREERGGPASGFYTHLSITNAGLPIVLGRINLHSGVWNFNLGDYHYYEMSEEGRFREWPRGCNMEVSSSPFRHHHNPPAQF